MKIEVKNTNKVEINVGDVFISDEGYGYVLHNKNDKFTLYNLNGKTFWIDADSKDKMDEIIISALKDNSLTHYPQDKFKLVLEEII